MGKENKLVLKFTGLYSLIKTQLWPSGSCLKSQHFGRVETGGSLEVKSSRPASPTCWNPISTKNTNISWAWWRPPIVPATQEAEVGEQLKPGRKTLRWAEIVPLHSSLGNEWNSISIFFKKCKHLLAVTHWLLRKLQEVLSLSFSSLIRTSHERFPLRRM